MSLLDACVNLFDEGSELFGCDDAKKVDVGIWISVSRSVAASKYKYRQFLAALSILLLIRHRSLRTYNDIFIGFHTASYTIARSLSSYHGVYTTEMARPTSA